MTESSHLQAALGRGLDACIHCGLCLPACPTYRESGNEAESPRGRLYLMQALLEGRLAPGPDASAPLDSCVGCRACETACPAGVPYGSLLEISRRLYVEPSRPVGVRTLFWRPLLRRGLSDRRRFAALAFPADLARRALAPDGRARAWLPRGLGRSLEALPAPQPAVPIAEWTEPTGVPRGTVAFLSGCAMPTLYGRANAATVRLLARAGYRVWVPPAQRCCGAINAHDGDGEGAEARARANLTAFAGPKVDLVVANAGGCGASLRAYGEWLAHEPGLAAEAAAFSAKVRDFSELLDEAELPLPEPPTTTTTSGRVTYHDPCHLAHGAGVRQAPRRLLRRFFGERFVELAEADWCCGGAGSYTLLQPELSDRLLAHKLAHIRDAGAETIVTANLPCLMQIGAGLAREGRPVRLVHLAELLDEAYGATPPGPHLGPLDAGSGAPLTGGEKG